MNRRLMGMGWILLLLTVGACQTQQGDNTRTSTVSTTTPATTPIAKADQTKTVDDLRELLAKHDKALSEKNVDAVMSTYSTEKNPVMLGTGVGERWVGQDAIKAAYTEMFKDYDPGTLVANCDWKTGGVDDAGTTAWLAATCQCSDSMKNKKREYTLN